MERSTIHSILLLSRSWHGHGGMQRLSRDLAGELCALYGNKDVLICYPKRRGGIFLFLFCVRSLWLSLVYKPDYVHCMDASILPLGNLCRSLCSGRLTLTACGLDIVYAARWYQTLLSHHLKKVHKIAAISYATKDLLQQKGVNPSCITVIPCGVKNVSSEPGEKRDPQLLLMIGRFVPRKGMVWFLREVMPLLIESNPLIKLAIIGSGPEEAAIYSAIAMHHLSMNVTVVPNADDETKNVWLTHASLFIAPNIEVKNDIEGFGIVCIEASIRGTQVLASNIQGLRDSVIDHETGQHVPPEDANAYVTTILQMLTYPLDPALVQSATLKHFSWNESIKLYCNFIFDA